MGQSNVHFAKLETSDCQRLCHQAAKAVVEVTLWARGEKRKWLTRVIGESAGAFQLEGPLKDLPTENLLGTFELKGMLFFGQFKLMAGAGPPSLKVDKGLFRCDRRHSYRVATETKRASILFKQLPRGVDQDADPQQQDDELEVFRQYLDLVERQRQGQTIFKVANISDSGVAFYVEEKREAQFLAGAILKEVQLQLLGNTLKAPNVQIIHTKKVRPQGLQVGAKFLSPGHSFQSFLQQVTREMADAYSAQRDFEIFLEKGEGAS